MRCRGGAPPSLLSVHEPVAPVVVTNMTATHGLVTVVVADNIVVIVVNVVVVVIVVVVVVEVVVEVLV